MQSQCLRNGNVIVRTKLSIKRFYMDKLKEFEETKNQYESALKNYEIAGKILQETKMELRKLTSELKEWLAKFGDELGEEIKPTFRTAIVELLEKEPVDKPFISIGQRYEEKYCQPKDKNVKSDKISPEEKEIFDTKIKDKLLKTDVKELNKLGITQSVIRNWFARGTNPSKENYDKLVCYFKE